MRPLLFTVPDRITDILSIIKGIDYVDFIDIGCVAILFYYLYKFIKERRAGKLAVGILILFALQIVSSIADMYLLQYIMQNIFQVGIITLVILFQPEIRSVLEKVGTQPLKSLKSIGETKSASSSIPLVIDEVVDAVCDFSEEKTGALIVFERSTKLGDMILTGTVIDAQPVAFLIKNIFFNKAPMHDGAMIIRDGRIHAAGCLLPLSNNPDIIKDLGTRHRAGIGMSENSDALVLIVSEETGTISAALEGNLRRGFNRATLTEFLRSELLEDSGDRKKFNFKNMKNAVKEMKLPDNSGKNSSN